VIALRRILRGLGQIFGLGRASVTPNRTRADIGPSLADESNGWSPSETGE